MAIKICLVSNTAWSFVRFRLDLIKSLVDQQYDVLLLAPKDESVDELKVLGVRFVPLEKMARKGMNPIADVLLYREFVRIYAQEKPDLVIQYTIKPNVYSTLAAKRNNIPVIAVVTGLGYAFINKGIVTAVAKKLYRFALRRADKVWFLNDDDYSFFINKNLVDENKASKIPGEGINCSETYNPALFATDNHRHHGVKFLFIGRLLYDKGIREYVEAAGQIKKEYADVTFEILGYLNVDNPAAVQSAQLEKWVKAGWVNYLGAVDDVRPIIAAVDCVVLPSYREGMSTTLQESASMAKPLIASDIAGCRELVDEGKNGYLCEVKNVDSLAACMRKVIQLSPEERRVMGQTGRRKMINSFSIDKALHVYRTAISEILNTKN